MRSAPKKIQYPPAVHHADEGEGSDGVKGMSGKKTRRPMKSHQKNKSEDGFSYPSAVHYADEGEGSD